MYHDDAVVWTLKFSVWPRLTLMEVANPWMLVSPTPLTCQLAMGSPGLLFSQVMGLPPVPQGSIAPARPVRKTAGTPTAITGASTATRQVAIITRVSPNRDDFVLM